MVETPERESMKTKLLDGRTLELRADDPLGIGRCGWYETLLSSLLISAAKPDYSFVDVGANIGWYSCLLAPHVKNVVALEPEDENHRILLLNASGHPNIQCIKAAAGAEEASATLAVNPTNTADSRLVQGASVWPCQKVDVIRLDDVGANADILKIDVQGHELGVLLGGEKTLESSKVVAIELTPGMMVNGRAEDAVDLLCKAGFSSFISIRRQSRAETLNKDGLVKVVRALGNRKHIDVFCHK
jgi:FkbM family methyltransferase